MTGLVDKYGNPLRSEDFKNKKAAPPALGERFGQWAGDDIPVLRLPGGGTVAFDTTQLTLSDLRQMKGHYQINSSLSVLTFMMHQMDWHIEVEERNSTDAQRKRIEETVERQLGTVWSRLVRAQSQSLWAGYSPNVLQWENDIDGREIVLSKIKDLYPEDCRVHWKKVTNKVPGTDGAVATHNVYDGIRQFGAAGVIPTENSYWYPLLMENGNYYGRRILESAFQPWFFSTLLHLFANRYYERFGEPVPIGRAPYEDEIDVNGTSVKGNQLMSMILQSLRNRSTVVLPNEKTPIGNETNPSFDYQIEYLESQMRGADFERYMTRLDEEMSLAMFTPILLMRTADVGSYNLGTQHNKTYDNMLNAISGDWSDYIDRYLIRPIVRYNFGDRAPRARIRFMKMGKVDKEILAAIISQLIAKGSVKPDIREIGEFTGMTFTEIETVTEEGQPPPEEEPAPEEDQPSEDDEPTQDVAKRIKKRVRLQVEKAFRQDTFGTDEWSPEMGYRSQMISAFRSERFTQPEVRVDDLYDEMDKWLTVTSALGKDEFSTPDSYMRFFDAQFDTFMSIFKR